jgi:predicted DNA-binding transcriptional regulator
MAVQENRGKRNDDDELERFTSELKGNTLLLYWFMLRHNRPFRAREIQRAVGLSSSSLALHHLNKLMELDLVKTDDDGCYIIARKVKPGLLSLFAGSGRTLIPRFVLYAVFYSTLLVSCVYLFWGHFDAATTLLILTLLISSLLFWVEFLRMWKIQPL